jgi:hypothetical protein
MFPCRPLGVSAIDKGWFSSMQLGGRLTFRGKNNHVTKYYTWPLIFGGWRGSKQRKMDYSGKRSVEGSEKKGITSSSSIKLNNLLSM